MAALVDAAIVARFWHAQRNEKKRRNAKKAARRRRCHKLRLTRFHNRRYRISCTPVSFLGRA